MLDRDIVVGDLRCDTCSRLPATEPSRSTNPLAKEAETTRDGAKRTKSPRMPVVRGKGTAFGGTTHLASATRMPVG